MKLTFEQFKKVIAATKAAANWPRKRKVTSLHWQAGRNRTGGIPWHGRPQQRSTWRPGDKHV